MKVTITSSHYGREEVLLEEESEDLVDVFGWYIDAWRDLLHADSIPVDANLRMTDAMYEEADYAIYREAASIDLPYLQHVQANVGHLGLHVHRANVYGTWTLTLRVSSVARN